MSEFVMVPVPPDRVVDVYRLLGREPEPAKPDGGALGSEWTPADIRRCYRESPDVVKSLMATLARNAEKKVLANELSESVGYTSHQFAGAMGAFGRRVKNRYQKTSWPFLAAWSQDAEMMEYRMSLEVAEVILEELG